MSYAEDQALANRLAPYILAKIRQPSRVLSSTPVSSVSSTQIFQAVLSQDGSGSELDADTVDGLHGIEFVLKSSFDANTILKADSDDTPSALSIPSSTLVGRGASGGIAALNASDARTVLGLGSMATESAGDYLPLVNAWIDGGSFADAYTGAQFVVDGGTF